MELIDKEIKYQSSNTEIRIYNIGDIHKGNIGHNRKRLMQDVEKIKNDPNAYWINGGDSIDAIVHSDVKRFDPMTIAPEFRESYNDMGPAQIASVKRDLDSIKDKCLGIHEGNHESKLRKYHHYDLVNAWCADWKVPYLKAAAMLRIKFNRGMHTSVLKILTAHGNVAGRRSGGKVNKLEDLVMMFDADVYMLAHGHKKVMHSTSRLSIPTKGQLDLVEDKKVGFMTGSYMNTYQSGAESYAETALYAPSDLGAVCVVIVPESKELWLEG